MKRLLTVSALWPILTLASVHEPDTTAHAPAGDGSFTIGGSVYTDLHDPIGSGKPGVPVSVQCEHGFASQAVTVAAPAPGLWRVDGVPEDTCIVTPSFERFCFQHVARGESDCTDIITIVVNASNQRQNQSIQFLAVADCNAGVGPGPCCMDGGTCESLTRAGCGQAGGRYLGDGLTCEEDPDGDGVLGCDDVCPCAPAPGDLTGDRTINLLDAARLIPCLGGPAAPIGPSCGAADLDCNGFIDLRDFASFQRLFGGP